MRFRCLISYRVSGGRDILSWKHEGLYEGTDHATIAADMIQKIKRIKHRHLHIIGITVLDLDAQEAIK